MQASESGKQPPEQSHIESINFRPSPNFKHMKKYLKSKPEESEANDKGLKEEDKMDSEREKAKALHMERLKATQNRHNSATSTATSISASTSTSTSTAPPLLLTQPPLPPNPPPPDSPVIIKEEYDEADYQFAQEMYSNYAQNMIAGYAPKQMVTTVHSQAMPASQQPAGQQPADKEIKMCRNFIRGTCMKGDSCIFVHQLRLDQLHDVYTFCRNFQNGHCNYPNCKFVHATLFERENFFRTGYVPPHTLAHLKNAVVPAATATTGVTEQQPVQDVTQAHYYNMAPMDTSRKTHGPFRNSYEQPPKTNGIRTAPARKQESYRRCTYPPKRRSVDTTPPVAVIRSLRAPITEALRQFATQSSPPPPNSLAALVKPVPAPRIASRPVPAKIPQPLQPPSSIPTSGHPSCSVSPPITMPVPMKLSPSEKLASSSPTYSYPSFSVPPPPLPPRPPQLPRPPPPPPPPRPPPPPPPPSQPAKPMQTFSQPVCVSTEKVEYVDTKLEQTFPVSDQPLSAPTSTPLEASNQDSAELQRRNDLLKNIGDLLKEHNELIREESELITLQIMSAVGAPMMQMSYPTYMVQPPLPPEPDMYTMMAQAPPPPPADPMPSPSFGAIKRSWNQTFPETMLEVPSYPQYDMSAYTTDVMPTRKCSNCDASIFRYQYHRNKVESIVKMIDDIKKNSSDVDAKNQRLCSVLVTVFKTQPLAPGFGALTSAIQEKEKSFAEQMASSSRIAQLNEEAAIRNMLAGNIGMHGLMANYMMNTGAGPSGHQ